MPGSTVRALILVLGVLVCVLAYSRGLSGPLLFDDVHVIQNNKDIRIDSLESGALLEAAASFMNHTRQLSMLSFAVNHYFFGDSVMALKAVTVGLHVVVGLLLYCLSRTFASYARRRELAPDNWLLRWAPEIVTILWLLSPINLTSVLYVSQRMAVLSGLFVVGGVLIYTRARVKNLDGARFPVLSALGIVLCLLAAYASKENGLLLVPFILAVELVLFGFRTRTGEVSQTVLGAAAALVLVAVAVVVVTERVDLSRVLTGYGIREFTLEERLLTQPRVLLFYIGLILFPAVGRFGIWHDDFPTSTSLLSPPDTLLAIFVIVLLFAIAVVVRKRYPLASLGILWFFVGHAIESTVFPLEMIHEHRNYIASFGVLLVLVTFLAQLSQVRVQLKVAMLVLLGVAASFNLTLRAEDWSSFLRHAVSEYLNHPNSARATFHMANVNVLLAARGHREAKEPAYELYRRASDLDPSSILPDVGMVIATTQLDGGYDTRWISNAVTKIRSTGGLPSDVAAFKGLRRCVEDGKCEFKVADLDPLFEAAADSRNHKLLIEAAIFQSTAIGNGDRALVLLKEAMEMAPRQLVPRLNYIEALTQAGRTEEARKLLFSMEADGVRALSTERDWIERLKSELTESG